MTRANELASACTRFDLALQFANYILQGKTISGSVDCQVAIARRRETPFDSILLIARQRQMAAGAPG